MIKQKFDSREINELFSRFIGTFIVPCESSEPVKPSEGSLHDPSERFWCKPVGSVGGRADFYVNVEISFDVIHKLTSIASVNKAFADRGPCIGNLLADRRCQMGIVYSGIAYHAAKNETVTFNGNRPFYSFHFLVSIIAVVTQSIAPFGALCVQRHHRRRRVLFALSSDFHDKFLNAVFNASVVSPFVEIPIDRLPFGKVMRKHAPLAAADKNEEHGLKYGTERMFTVSTIIFKEYFVYIRPLTLGQMCLIESDYMHDIKFYSSNTLIEGLLCLVMFNLV